MVKIRGSRLFTAALYSYKVLMCFEVVLGICVDHMVYSIEVQCSAIEHGAVHCVCCSGSMC